MFSLHCVRGAMVPACLSAAFRPALAALGAVLLLGGTACDPGYDDATADTLDVAEHEAAANAGPTALRAEPDDVAVDSPDCAGVHSSPAVVVAWPSLPRDADLPLGEAATLPLEVRNAYAHDLVVQPRMTVGTADRKEHQELPSVSLRAGESVEVDVPLPRWADTREYPAQILLSLRPFEEGRRMSDVRAAELYVHLDEASGQWLAYDEVGLVERHAGGDRLGKHSIPADERDHLVAVGRAHVAHPDELQGDPADVEGVHDGVPQPHPFF